MPEVKWLTAFLDVPGAVHAATVGFWTAATGSTLSPVRGDHGQFATVVPADGDAYLRIQRIDDGAAGCHLDVHVDDVAAAQREAVALGATVTATLADGFQILSSPGGSTFCVVAHHGESVRPRPPEVRVDRRNGTSCTALVDQLCLDVGADRFDDECTFWSTFTGWELRPSLPEFRSLLRPAGQPLRLLIQRLDDPPAAGAGRAHLDLSCADVAAAAEVHQVLGASVEKVNPYWTTMVDPAGLRYCLTARNPVTGLIDPSFRPVPAR